MRRAIFALLATVLTASMLAFSPATSEEGSTTDSGTTESSTTEESTLITPDPVEVTMYFHGEGERGVDEDQWLAGPPPMDRNEPTASEPESKQLTNYAIGPNNSCAANGLWPIWAGYVGEGTIVGDATVTFDVVGSTPGDVVVKVWKDVSGQACNEAYPTPDASATVTLPPGAGTVEVPVPTDGLAPEFQLLVQIQPLFDGPEGTSNPVTQGRVLYDSVDYMSSITFTCQPDDVETEAEAAAADCSLF